MPRDMHYTNGQWTPIDLFADCPDNADVNTYLKSTGWEEFLSVGAETDGPINLKTWQRTRDDGVEYLLEVNDVHSCSPYMKVDTFPDLMDLMARWSPVIQTASVTYVLNDLIGVFIDDTNGLVERIAARAKFGVEQMYGPMVRERERQERDRREAVRRMRAEREARRPQNPPA